MAPPPQPSLSNVTYRIFARCDNIVCGQRNGAVNVNVAMYVYGRSNMCGV